MRQNIYLDNNATTEVVKPVIDEMILSFHTTIGNPSSIHSYGKSAKYRLQEARDEIASYLSVSPREIIFSSGATEALNLVLRGLKKPCHIISSDLEHPAVYLTLKEMEKEGFSVSFLQGGLYGAITLDAVQKACKENTSLIALMAVNNETGVKTDIRAIAEFAKEKSIDFVVDGVALLGKEEFEIPDGVSAMCFSGHKFHAPKGIGFAFIRKSLKLKPLITGGEQEFGRRSGTENLPGIIALQKAIQLLKTELPEATFRMEKLRDRLEIGLRENLSNVIINGQGPRICNTSNLCFQNIDGELLMAKLDNEGIAISLGSACASGAIEPSRILLNMGLSIDDASSSIRFSLSRFTTEEEIDRTVEAIIRIIRELN